MNNFVGWCREKLGRSTHKAVLMVPIAATDRIYPANYKGTHLQSPIKHYEAVAAHYFKPGEKLWKWKKDFTYELHPENTSYVRNEAKLQFINKVTGAPITFDELKSTVFTPEALTQTTAAEWVKNAHASVKGLGMGPLIIILCIGFGIVLGFLVGNNWTGIVNAVAPKATPTPYPIVIP